MRAWQQRLGDEIRPGIFIVSSWPFSMAQRLQ